MKSTSQTATLSPLLASKIQEVAKHFGFEHIDRATKRLSERCTDCNAQKKKAFTVPAPIETDVLHNTLTEGVRSYLSALPYADAPNQLFFNVTKGASPKEIHIAFHAVHVQGSIAEITLIQTLRSLVAHLGFREDKILVNTIGDQDSKKRYVRELTSYIRRNSNSITPEVEEKIRKGDHILDIYRFLMDHGIDFIKRAPMPFDHLNEKSRRHFREVIEYFDVAECPYEMDPLMFGIYGLQSGPLYSIDGVYEGSEAGMPTFCSVRGGRYDSYTLAETGGLVPSASAVMVLNGISNIKQASSHKDSDCSSACVYIIEIGQLPKMYGMTILDTLLHAGIRAAHSITHYTLREQLAEAERVESRFAIIVGQHEVLSREVIVRDMATQTQMTVPVTKLVSKIKMILER